MYLRVSTVSFKKSHSYWMWAFSLVPAARQISPQVSSSSSFSSYSGFLGSSASTKVRCYQCQRERHESLKMPQTQHRGSSVAWVPSCGNVYCHNS
ncbi:hypothetical protein DL93DRAFT_510698 [Clavulina sp. PMI_390]|nr:hypothetical protein DL93DRAFT_510698 [Clavulina sp. PMI_390]